MSALTVLCANGHGSGHDPQHTNCIEKTQKSSYKRPEREYQPLGRGGHSKPKIISKMSQTTNFSNENE